METDTKDIASKTHTNHIQKGRILEYITVGLDLLEALGAIIAAALSGSVALLSYGIDSVIEVSSGSILLWRLQEGEKGEEREQTAARLVGISLFALAVYILYDAGSALFLHQPPETSYLGIAVAAVSVVAMPLLAPGQAQRSQRYFQQGYARRFPPNRYLCLFVRYSFSWVIAERPVWMVVG